MIGQLNIAGVELRKVTTHWALSRETLAYFADVWIDGVKAGNASNDGGGGPDNVYIFSDFLKDKLHQIVKAQPPLKYLGFNGVYAELTTDIDLFLNNIMELNLAGKRLISDFSKGYIVFKKDDILFTTRMTASQVRQQHPYASILNDLPLKEAALEYIRLVQSS